MQEKREGGGERETGRGGGGGDPSFLIGRCMPVRTRERERVGDYRVATTT